LDEQLRSASWKVLAADYAEPGLREVQDIALHHGQRMMTQAIDVRKQEDIQGLFQRAAEIRPIEVVIHCVGITARRSLLQTSEEVCHNILETNLSGTFYCLQAAAVLMKEQHTGGSILAITSINVYRPLASQAIYTATKAAIDSMVRTLACEVGPFRIRVNALAPGAIDTPMNQEIPKEDLDQLAHRIPWRRLGTPHNLVAPALFLVSPAAEYITGTTLVVDGGLMTTR
jgi:NAD(P)-dependent dehydrogenase (short-subunit alcohol dehydrogenase family)